MSYLADHINGIVDALFEDAEDPDDIADMIRSALDHHAPATPPVASTIGPIGYGVLREAATVILESEAASPPPGTDEEAVIAGLVALIHAGWQILPPDRT